MIFVKQTNGNVLITTDTNVTVKMIQDTGVQIEVIGALSDTVQISQFGYPVYIIPASDVSATQIEPAASIPFAGTAADLVDILAADFFLSSVVGTQDVNILSSVPLDVNVLSGTISVTPVTAAIAYTTTANLAGGATYDSGILELLPDYTHVQTNITADQNGTIIIYWYSDAGGTDIVRTLNIPFVASEGYKVYSAPAGFGRYVRYTFVNGATPQGDFYYSTTFMTGSVSPQLLNIESPVSPKMVAQMNRSVLMGVTDGGQYLNVPVTQEGHLEVSVHDPILPFGSMHVENMTPIFQADGIYGLVLEEKATTSGSGTATATDGMYTVSTGTTIYSQGVIQGRKRLRYRAGQGVVGRFTSLFSAPVANSYQLVGFGHAESGIYVGYGNTSNLADTRLGILHVTGGVREVKTLTITTGATVAGNVTITLNGTAFNVAVTNSANIQRTVYEIAQGTFTGWDAYPSGATVVFIRNSSGVTAGTQAFAPNATGSTGAIVQTKAGAASTDTFYPQDTWNGDKLDGTGASGATLDPTKLNIWQIGIGYLGTDSLVVKYKASATNSNNSTWVIVHTIRFPNTRTTPIFSNPSFPFTIAAYSAGSTTNLTVKNASNAGFIEGKKVLHGNRFTYFNSLTTVGAANLQALFTIMNARVYQGVSNQAVINLLNASGAIKHNSPVIYYLIRNGVLAGNPNFQQLATNSCSLYDTAATTVTYSSGAQLVATFHVGDTGEFDHHFGNGDFNAEEVTLQPGEWITLAVKSVAGSPSYVTGSINTREDQ